MRRLEVKEEYVKSTGSFIGGIILNYLVEVKRENKLSSKFNINLEALKEVTMLDVSEATIRREIKKLIKSGFVIVEKKNKTHSYEINEEYLKEVFIKIGAINEVERFIENDEMVNSEGVYKQIDIESSIKKVREINHEQNNITIHYNSINTEESQHKNNSIEQIEDYLKEKLEYEYLVENNKNEFDAKLFDRVYRIILEVITTDAEKIRINGKNIYSEVVKSVFKKLDSYLLMDIVFKLKRLNNKIVNFKNYIITVIYNTYLENSFKLQNELYINEGIIC